MTSTSEANSRPGLFLGNVGAPSSSLAVRSNFAGGSRRNPILWSRLLCLKRLLQKWNIVLPWLLNAVSTIGQRSGVPDTLRLVIIPYRESGCPVSIRKKRWQSLLKKSAPLFKNRQVPAEGLMDETNPFWQRCQTRRSPFCLTCLLQWSDKGNSQVLLEVPMSCCSAKNQGHLPLQQRPIGKLARFFRLWASIRLKLTRHWRTERAWEWSWGCGRRRGALDASWDVSCHAEQAWATGRSFGGILFDLRQCFDRVALGNLQFALLEHSFPPSLSSVALHQYAAPRILSAAGATAGWIKPLSGITAGCPLATDVILCYFATAVNKLTPFRCHGQVVC